MGCQLRVAPVEALSKPSARVRGDTLAWVRSVPHPTRRIVMIEHDGRRMIATLINRSDEAALLCADGADMAMAVGARVRIAFTAGEWRDADVRRLCRDRIGVELLSGADGATPPLWTSRRADPLSQP